MDEANFWTAATPEPLEGQRWQLTYRTPHENFGGDRLRGGGWANTQFVPPVYIFLVSDFFDSFYKATAETAEPIFTLNSSNDGFP